MAELAANSGIKYCPESVAALASRLDEVVTIRNTFTDESMI